MARSIRHEDLVARALGALDERERAAVDRALEADAALRRRFEEVAGHLLQYDRLPPSPPPPPFERLAARLDAEGRPDLGVLALQRRPRPRARRVRWAALAAALLLVGLLVARPWQREAGPQGARLVPGAGLELLRNGRALPAPAHAALEVRAGDVLHCARAAEARLGERVRLVLDAGARLRVHGAERVRLEQGRTWFEVAPGPFEVDTPYGPVRVLGTAFEVDVRTGALSVAVVHGRVRAGELEIAAGLRWAGGRLAALEEGAPGWFRRPALHLERVVPGPHPAGTPLALRLVLENPGNVPLSLPAPPTARTPMWLSFETAPGRVLGELPVLPANVRAGLALLQPGADLVLAPGERRALTLEILPPVGSPGAYRCRALYRPAGQPGVLSPPLEFEVR